MRKLTTLLLLLSVAFAQAQHAQDSAWIKEHYYKIERYIPMRDGVKLFTSIYLPKDSSQQHPILLTRTPYSCAPYGETNFRPALWTTHLRYYARENYIIITQDVRGRWMSEGSYVDIRPFNPNKKGKEFDEASDTYDAIDWMVHNLPFNNGKVGVFGISYPGFYSTMAALSGHPALKAVSPQAPVTEWFLGDDFHHNGALMIMDCFAFYAGGFGYPRPVPTSVGPSSTLKISTADNYETYLRIGALSNFKKLAGDSLTFFNELFDHPDYDAWWQARNPRNFVDSIKPAMLTVGGLYDAEDCFGAWNLYKAMEKKNPGHFNKLVMGPWYHGQWASADGSHLGNVRFNANTSFWYQNNIEIPFFNYFLKGEGDTSSLAEATVFAGGENKWHQYAQWPPAETKNTALYLQPGGSLGWTKPPANGGFSEYVSDPAHPVPYTEDVHFGRTREYMTDDQRFAARRPDVLTFQTPVLTSAVTLGGVLTADLLTRISSTDADFVVKLIDVYPDNFSYPDNTPASTYPMGGYQQLVRGEIMRGRYRNNFSKPEAFRPNQTERVKFDLPDVSHCFLPGHRIMVQVQSSWFPIADRNPQKFINIYKATDADFQKATIRILHDAGNSSSIMLPVISR